MDKKKVIVTALLLLAVVLSAASIMMNVAVDDKISISQGPSGPDVASIGFVVLDTPAEAEGSNNG